MIGTSWFLLYRRVLRPLFVRFADLDIAMRIEERWPGLNDRLASTIQFLRLDASDDRYGSSALREATVRQAIEETSGINFREVIEPRPVVRAVGLAAGVLALAGLVMIAAPAFVADRHAAVDLPFGAWNGPSRPTSSWTTRTPPSTRARATSSRSSVKVRPRRQGPRVRTTRPIASPMARRRSSRCGPRRWRVPRPDRVGQSALPFHGDRGRRRHVDSRRGRAGRPAAEPEVVDHPNGLPALHRGSDPDAGTRPDAAPSPGRNEAGTRGRGQQAPGTRQLRIGEDPAGGALAFDASRTRFKTAIPVKGSFTFWFGLQDTEGFLNRDEVRYDVRGFKDEAPRVVIEEPKTDRDVPADATVPVRIVLDDDFGLHSARLIYRVATGESEPHDEAVIPLWTAKDQSPAPVASIVVKHQELAHNWQLAPLKLPVGTVITYYADARDLDTIKGPNVGKSRELRLRIVSKEDAARQFDDARATSARRSPACSRCRSKPSPRSRMPTAPSRKPTGFPRPSGMTSITPR